jgi:WD40 repeat protein
MSAAQSFISLEALQSLRFDDYIHRLCWSPNGKYLAIGLSCGVIEVLRVSDGVVLRFWQAHLNGLMDLCWSAKGSVFASGGQDGQVCFWDADSGACLARHAYSEWIEHLSWSRHGIYLAVASGRLVDIFNLDGELLRRHEAHTSTVSALQWSSNHKMVLSSSYGQVRFLPIKGQEPNPLLWKTSLIALALSPNERYLAAGTQDATIHFWPLPYRVGRDLEMSGFPAKIHLLDWSSNGRYLASNCQDEIIVWDTSDQGPEGRRPSILGPHFKKVNCFAFMPGQDLLASGDLAGTVRLLQLDESDSILDQDELSGPVSALSWAPRAKMLAGASASGRVRIWQTNQSRW